MVQKLGNAREQRGAMTQAAPTRQLTADEALHIQSAFNLYDKEGSGAVTAGQLKVGTPNEKTS